jgi:hypothetical protein
MSAAMTPWASDEIRPACGAGKWRFGRNSAPGRADETVGLIHQVEHRRNDDRAGEDADDERPCCFHGVASTSWPVLRSCRLLFAIAATLKTTAVVKSAKRSERLGRVRADIRLDAEHEQQRRADHDQNADAGERAVGRTDQARHVTADRRDEEAHQNDIEDAADDERPHVRRGRSVAK